MRFKVIRNISLHFCSDEEDFSDIFYAKNIYDAIEIVKGLFLEINELEFKNIDSVTNHASFVIKNRMRYEGDWFVIQKIDMEFNEYDEKARATAIYPDKLKITYPSMGLCGEAGEVIDKIKKAHRDNNSIFTQEIKEDIAKEIGDVLWYCSALANDLGYSLEEIAEMNINKLESRKNRGVIQGSGDNR